MPFPAVPWEVWGLFRWIFALWKKQNKTKKKKTKQNLFWRKYLWGSFPGIAVLISNSLRDVQVRVLLVCCFVFFFLCFSIFSSFSKSLVFPSFKGFVSHFFLFVWNNPMFECFWSFLRFEYSSPALVWLISIIPFARIIPKGSGCLSNEFLGFLEQGNSSSQLIIKTPWGLWMMLEFREQNSWII